MTVFTAKIINAKSSLCKILSTIALFGAIFVSAYEAEAASSLETLAIWPTSSSTGETSLFPTECASAIESPSLNLTTSDKTTTTVGFGGTKWNDLTKDDAVSNGNYIDITFSAATDYTLSSLELYYRLERADKGPTSFIWQYSVDNAAFTDIGEEFTFSSSNTKTLDLSSIGEVASGSTVTIRLVAWGATASTGTLYLKGKDITLSGIVTFSGTLPPAIAEVPEQYAYVGETLATTIDISGEITSPASTNITTSATLSGEYAITNGIFYYTPTEEDLSLSPVSFTLTLTAPLGTAECTFDVVISEAVNFIETFDGDDAKKGSYKAGDLTGDTGAWHATNAIVANPGEKDYYIGVRGIKMQGYEGILEMRSDKLTGIGSITLWHGLRSDSASEDATWQLYFSTDSGKTWSTHGVEAVAPAKSFERTTIDNINIEGRVRIRIIYTTETKSRYFYIDDIRITDYGTPATPDEEETPDTPTEITAISLRNGKTVRENFDTIGTAAKASLPTPWRVAATNIYDEFTLDYHTAALTTDYRAGTNSSATTAGIYNIGAGHSESDDVTERAIGFMSSDSKAKVCALIVAVRNDDTLPISGIRIDYDIEKYRTGNAKIIDVRSSQDGINWTPASEELSHTTETDTADDKVYTKWTQTIPAPSVHKSGWVNVKLQPKETIYLAWFYYSEKSSEAAKAQVLAIDNIAIRPGRRTIYMLH